MNRATVLATAILLLLAGNVLAKEYHYTLDETYPIDPNGTLHLQTNDAEVVIIGSDRSDVHIVVDHLWKVSGISIEKRGDFTIDVQESNGDLRIRERSEGSFSIVAGSVREEYTVTIEAPNSIDLRLEGDDDDYRVRNFSGEVRLDFEDGDAELREMSGNHFEFSFDDGSVELFGGSGMLDAYFEDGDLVVEDGSFYDLSVTLDDGAAMVASSLADDGRYRMRAADGDLGFHVLAGGGEFRVNFDDGRSRASREFEQLVDEEHHARYRLPGGEAQVRLELDDGRVTLRAE